MYHHRQSPDPNEGRAQMTPDRSVWTMARQMKNPGQTSRVERPPPGARRWVLTARETGSLGLALLLFLGAALGGLVEQIRANGAGLWSPLAILLGTALVAGS